MVVGYNNVITGGRNLFFSIFRKGFTLAEVLITLGIIGIVAAMTLPSLTAKQHEKQTVAKLKKVYSTLQQAQLSIVSEYGTFDNLINTGTEKKDENDNTILDYEDTDKVKNLFAKYLKVIKNCKSGTNCLGKTVYYLSGKIGGTFQDPTLVLADGTKIFFGWTYLPCTKTNRCLDIGVALPGAYKDRYIIGKDIFYFAAYSDRIVPEPYSTTCKRDKSGRGCAAWVIVNENMDYLHCNDLNWNTKTKCKQ